MRRVAVVGSGIAGLAVAHGLARHARVTLFEAGDYFGGHTHTVDVTLDGVTHGVDTGFLVLQRAHLPEPAARCSPSSASRSRRRTCRSRSQVRPAAASSGAAASLDSVFAQRRNLLRPRFWRMLGRHRCASTALATALAATRRRTAERRSTSRSATSCVEHRFCAEFRDWYFLPMIGCIWSCPTDQMLRFPVATMIRFCHNHGLLQVADRPQWLHGARRRAPLRREDASQALADARLNTPVRGVRRASASGARR